MFQFPRLPPGFKTGLLLAQVGYPIRESTAKLAGQLTEAFRSLATPFIGFWCQGIPRAPLIA